MITFFVPTPESMIALGQMFASIVKGGDVLALDGELGAGKTTFTRGFVSTLCPEAKVASPTFVLIREYPGDLTVFHCDMYRINSSDEAYGMGIEDIFDSNSVAVIEWAERIQKLLPSMRIDMKFRYFEKGRVVECSYPEEKKELIQRIYENFGN